VTLASYVALALGIAGIGERPRAKALLEVGLVFRGLKAAATPKGNRNDKSRFASTPTSKERSLGAPACGNDKQEKQEGSSDDRSISICPAIVLVLLEISNWYSLGLLLAA